MKKIIILLLTALTADLFAQTKCDIKEYYGDFVYIQKASYKSGDKDKPYLIKGTTETKSKKCFSDVIKNTAYVIHLLTNFSSNANDSLLLQINDSVTLQKEYIKVLTKDTLFNRVMKDLISKTVEKNVPKDTISMDKLLNIAVKYFSVFKINPQGYYVGFVCGGRNDIEKTEKVRHPQLEAFCFSSIAENMEGDEFNMYDEFVKALKELYKVNLGVDNNERLFRAQGAMFLLMRNNEPLKKMLKSEYEKNKNILPFILKG